MGDPVIDPLAPKLHSRITELVAQYHLPGLAAGIVRDQALAWSAGFGFADIATERRPDERTLYRVGSITKTFTATVLMQLRDEDRLSLDDPLVRHIPEFGAVRCRYGTVEDVTLKRLLTHRSGLMGEPPLSHWETLQFPTIEQILASLPRVEVVIPPDASFKYSNLAFSLLGEVVARVSGRPYVEYVHAEILGPLGMDSSAFALTEELRPRMATGYDPNPYADDQTPSPHPIINGMASAGQLYSTVSDLAKWIALQFRTDRPVREGTQVLKGSSLEEMHRPLYLEPGWDAAYCPAWMAQRRGEHIYLGHGGGIHGFITQVLFNEARRTGAIILANGIGPSGEIAAQVLEMVLAADRDAPKGAAAQRPPSVPAEWQRFLGRYTGGMGMPVHVEFREGGLIIAVPPTPGVPPLPPTHLKPAGEPHVFEALDGRYAGEAVTFRLAPDGAVTGFVTSGFPYRKLVPAG